ncbi:lichenan-specific phosphotransferase enzyme IIA component LicA [Enterococcus silesiacus]|nr:lichenan-specific phosphotransferase enzyme IIA component LicA [Enterococcus silesiacus]
MTLISEGGGARAKSLQAIRAARAGDFAKSEMLMREAKYALKKAHNYQTKLIQTEIANQSIPISLLLIHAQDHLMNALTVNELSKEIIENLKERRD